MAPLPSSPQSLALLLALAQRRQLAQQAAAQQAAQQQKLLQTVAGAAIKPAISSGISGLGGLLAGGGAAGADLAAASSLAPLADAAAAGAAGASAGGAGAAGLGAGLSAAALPLAAAALPVGLFAATGGFDDKPQRPKTIEEILSNNTFDRQVPGFSELSADQQKQFVKQGLETGVIQNSAVDEGTTGQSPNTAFLATGSGNQANPFLTGLVREVPGGLGRSRRARGTIGQEVQNLSDVLSSLGSDTKILTGDEDTRTKAVGLDKEKLGALQGLIDFAKQLQGPQETDVSKRPTADTLRDFLANSGGQRPQQTLDLITPPQDVPEGLTPNVLKNLFGGKVPIDPGFNLELPGIGPGATPQDIIAGLRKRDEKPQRTPGFDEVAPGIFRRRQ